MGLLHVNVHVVSQRKLNEALILTLSMAIDRPYTDTYPISNATSFECRTLLSV